MPASQGRAAVTNPFLKAKFDKCHGKFRRHATRNPINHHGHGLKIVRANPVIWLAGLIVST